MNVGIARFIAGASLFAIATIAHANTTNDAFIDVANSVSFDGWNQLNRNRVDTDGNANPLTSAQLAAGTAGNVTGSGDALLTLISGSHYPAGAGLYGGPSTFTFTDNTVDNAATSLVFQGIINDFSAIMGGGDISFTLSYNGGSQNIAGNLVEFVNTDGISDYYQYTWDFSNLGETISSYTINFGIGYSQLLAFQIDQVAAVPEPETYAMLMLGLGIMGFAARRRSNPRI
ncbi:PEP-CTERM sorting domain-containing protein [Methylobacillus caricis]|uniref:PEP-CTERM sorting domain-containing protein n=1 Tax=Methylobacillus caricis TaxID=1971611 RepID=UPI001CFF98B8|nr:PEP-CTERM sorting domain-containing protein [Methylobacillus caricis]MCB5187188.1 PEP-CTERM sorting domain-containing protein [Methylobacillus caricis]